MRTVGATGRSQKLRFRLMMRSFPHRGESMSPAERAWLQQQGDQKKANQLHLNLKLNS